VTDPLAYFSKTGKDGISVRSHLAELIHTLLKSKDPDALAKLESLSLDVKQAHFDAKQPGSKEAVAPAAGVVETTIRGASVPTEGWLKAAKSLQTSTDPEMSSMPAKLQELPEQMSLFRGAGIGMTKEESYRTYLAMQALQEKYQPTGSVRFFGKILGTKKDYVVIEMSGCAHKPPAAVGATEPEKPGVGLNMATYFVAPSAVEEFVQLEDVTPEQVLGAMKIRKYFTGDLSAPVYCYPAFPGTEGNYLRAQIARIAQATALKPSGYLQPNEETGALELNPEYAVPADLDATAWVRGYGGILKIGRCTNVPKADPDAEDPEDLEEEVAPLGAITDDPPVATFGEEEDDSLGAWTARLYDVEFPAYTVGVAKSNRWPGAYAAIAKAGVKDACVYFGYGLEDMGKTFTLEAFPAIAAESEEFEEAAEPDLAAENAVLKEIDELKIAASNAEGEAEE